jgi:hypothetical protein
MQVECAECRKPCRQDRPQPFGVYACSALCEIALCDYLDEVSFEKVQAELERLRNDPTALQVALKQRGIRPDEQESKVE